MVQVVTLRFMVMVKVDCTCFSRFLTDFSANE